MTALLMLLGLVMMSVLVYKVLQDDLGFFEEEYTPSTSSGGTICKLNKGSVVTDELYEACDCVIGENEGFSCKPTKPTYHLNSSQYFKRDLGEITIASATTSPEIRKKKLCEELGLDFWTEGDYGGCKPKEVEH